MMVNLMNMLLLAASGGMCGASSATIGWHDSMKRFAHYGWYDVNVLVSRPIKRYGLTPAAVKRTLFACGYIALA
jgi:hypothetical protein